MGVDLRLLPVDFIDDRDSPKPWGYSHTILPLPRTRDLWVEIATLKPAMLPAEHNISSFVGAVIDDGRHQGERMYGRFKDRDTYGCAYTWVRAGDLAPLLAKHGPSWPATAYISALPPDTLIILDWH